VLAQQTFQLKRPKECDKEWAWPGDIPTEVLFDPLSTVSATYGVAFQTQFRDGQNVWSSRPTIFVIDRGGVLRHVDSRHDQDIREEGIFPALDELEQQRRLIVALRSKDAERCEAARTAVAPLGTRISTAIPALVKSLRDEDAQVRAGAAAALLWMAPRAEGAIPALTEALKDENPQVRQAATRVLKQIDPKAGQRK
jgi:hypothetical protein